MKTRLTLIFSALVVLLGAMIWVVEDRSIAVAAPLLAAQPAATPAMPTERVFLGNPTPDRVSLPSPAPTAAAAPVADAVPVAPQGLKTAPMVHVAKTGDMTYVARSGDTLSQLAIALLGTDSKEHRDAIVAANASLQPNPDRVLAGQTYSIAAVLMPAAEEETADDQTASTASATTSTATSSSTTEPAATTVATEAASSKEVAASAAGGPQMRYTAQRGDSVSTLASGLLGADTKANRDSIIAGNASLQKDADHLVAGKSYTITAPNGLSAEANASGTSSKVATDADDATRMSVGRSLRYTAQPGDSVSKLATVLLGSDTAANRDLIIKSNPTLLVDPTHLVAGKSYWITAPTADAVP